MSRHTGSPLAISSSAFANPETFQANEDNEKKVQAVFVRKPKAPMLLRVLRRGDSGTLVTSSGRVHAFAALTPHMAVHAVRWLLTASRRIHGEPLFGGKPTRMFDAANNKRKPSRLTLPSRGVFGGGVAPAVNHQPQDPPDWVDGDVTVSTLYQ